ncbi:MAG: zinc ribbon domain-containing protein [Gemmatimonadaceae bacterium]|jgi:predicted  nucleic acid-binding Zn-ribbon protein
MQQEVEALLALQKDDLKIREIESQIRSLDPQLAEFDRKKEQAAAALSRAQAAVQAEEKKQRELQSRLSQHKTMQERNLHQLEDVKRLREATAATAQVEATRRLMAEDESEIAILGRRINEMNAVVSTSKQAIATLEQEQQAARPEIEAQRAELQSQLDEAMRDRQGRAVSVSRPMLSKYDRIRGKRSQALYPLRGGSCGNCDTAVPLQRRNMMTASGQIEICEACGVLLYAEG